MDDIEWGTEPQNSGGMDSNPFYPAGSNSGGFEIVRSTKGKAWREEIKEGSWLKLEKLFSNRHYWQIESDSESGAQGPAEIDKGLKTKLKVPESDNQSLAEIQQKTQVGIPRSCDREVHQWQCKLSALDSTLISAAMSSLQFPLRCSHCGNDYFRQTRVHPELWDFDHLSRTNDAPTIDEVASIEADIAMREKEVQALRGAVEKLQGALDMIKPQLEDATEALIAHKIILHPVRRVPAEILRTIFIACMAPRPFETAATTTPLVGRSPVLPWNLSSVCRRWRGVSVGFPELWTTIKVFGLGFSRRGIFGRLGVQGFGIIETGNVVTVPMRGTPVEQTLQLMLKRSTTSLLHVTLDFSELTAQLPIVPNLLHSSSRWRILDLKVTDQQLDLFLPIHGHFDSLVELRLRLSNPCDSSVHSTPHIPLTVSVFAIAPSVGKVEIIYDKTYGPARAYRKLRIPWGTITEYSSEYPEISAGGIQLESLHLCANLTRAHLGSLNRYAINEITEGSVLPKLTELYLAARLADDVAILLDRLTLPALNSLSIHISRVWGDQVPESLSRLRYRSQFPLTTLELRGFVITDDEAIQPSIIAFLTTASTITHLSLDDECLDVLPHLIPDILPYLTHLKVTTDSKDGFQQKAVKMILDTAESRVGALKEIRLMLPEAPSEQAEIMLSLARVGSLHEAGLSFIVR
ncbi:hypothetical protein C8J56DRAFT_1072309 [Mycena floridula]|nr:hypothetical protein C8J56DRAFT_1072309 [Mycena floridula]